MNAPYINLFGRKLHGFNITMFGRTFCVSTHTVSGRRFNFATW